MSKLSEIKQEIKEVLESYQEFACGSEDPNEVAQEWLEASFTAEGVKKWLDAGCFHAESANDLELADITPEKAKEKIEIGGIKDTIGYWYANGDIKLEDIN